MYNNSYLGDIMLQTNMYDYLIKLLIKGNDVVA